MKKLLLFSLVVALVITTSCEKEPIIEATPPTGTWSELILVPILQEDNSIEMEELTFDEMLQAHSEGKVDLNTFEFVIHKFEFIASDAGPESGVLRVTVHYGDGQPVPSDCRSSVAPSLQALRTEYFQINYTINFDIHEGTKFHEKEEINHIIGSGAFTGASFGSSLPGSCSSQGTINKTYDYSYLDEEKTRISMGNTASGSGNFHLLEKR